jgi:DNA polymerase III subunit delta'
MNFNEIVGNQIIKEQLMKNVDSGRISHAQLFVGPEGCGTLPMAVAYTCYLLNKQIKSEIEIETNTQRIKKLAHPDLHFVYPTITTAAVSKKPKSIDFIENWRSFFKTTPYAGLFDWYASLGEDKQGEIRVDDAVEIVKNLSLKSYEGGYKVMIIWMAEKLNTEASNKILKLLEEPPAQTLFILVAENEEAIISTIRSRCQAVYFKPLTHQEITNALVEQNIPQALAQRIASQSNGNYNKALQLITEIDHESPFEQWFVSWVRTAFRAKKDASAIEELIEWSEKIASLGRESQKKFLSYCLDLFRQALLINYNAPQLSYFESKEGHFSLNKLAPFVNSANIHNIFEEISQAIYHIERNGNGKIILTDLSIKLTRLIHKK